MNILVLNASPKGDYSVTLQTVNYLARLFPEDTFTTLHVGQQIKALERDFSRTSQQLKAADVLLFSYPVYTFIAPSQLHRFIELVKEHNLDLRGKYATQITTSKHFYDVTAHRYVQDNCEDLGLRFVRGLSADMDDLLTDKGRSQAESFWRHFRVSVENGWSEPVRTVPYTAQHMPVTVPAAQSGEKSGDVVIIADLDPTDAQLAAMIERFRVQCPRKTRVVNLREFPFKGGCLGCFRCAADGKCVYTDGFDEFLRGSIQTAQAMVYAFTIRDHSMGARFKMYDDRQFCNGHRTVTVGMPVGYLISGGYAGETNLQTIIEGRAQVGANVLAGIATDERDPDGEIDKLARELDYALAHPQVPPRNFYGVGGMKIFRDLIYIMRGMMKADHKFYKANGDYDFPQKQKKTIAMMYLVGGLMASPKVRAKMGNKMNEGMLMPYKKLFEQLDRDKK